MWNGVGGVNGQLFFAKSHWPLVRASSIVPHSKTNRDSGLFPAVGYGADESLLRPFSLVEL